MVIDSALEYDGKPVDEYLDGSLRDGDNGGAGAHGYNITLLHGSLIVMLVALEWIFFSPLFTYSLYPIFVVFLFWKLCAICPQTVCRCLKIFLG